MKKYSTAELELVDICQEIGLVAGCNCHYTAGLAKRVESYGIPVRDMPVGVLLGIVREHTEWFNSQGAA